MDKTTPTVGKLLDGTEQRDAIHFALAPMVAAEELHPGQSFDTADGVRAIASVAGIGIVDPFLAWPVLPEQWFWGFLNPNTITALRHEWTHPAFSRPSRHPRLIQIVDPVESDKDEESDTRASETSAKTEQVVADKAASQLWMEQFASGHYSHYGEYYRGTGRDYDAEELIDAAKQFLQTGDRHVQEGSESLRDAMYEDIKGEFWKHFEVITDIKPNFGDDGDNPFCCTC